jgi:hypothetical protein
MSNSEQIKGNWNELKGKLNKNLQNLPKTIYVDEGKEDEMWGNYNKIR